MSVRRLVSSGSPFEPEVGFSRAVRVGTHISVAGTAPISATGSNAELLPKAKAARPDVPVIMITAYGDAETKRKALEGGAEALFTKPIDFGALRNEIDVRVERAA